MSRVKGTRALGLAGGLTIAVGVIAPSLALGQAESVPASPPPAAAQGGAVGNAVGAARQVGVRAPARMFIRLENAGNGTVEVDRRIHANVRIKPFVPQEEIEVRITHGGKTLKKRVLNVKQIGHRNVGRVSLESNKVLDPGNYRAVAVHHPSDAQQRDQVKSHQFHPVYPDLDPGQHNSQVHLFNELLRKQGYYVGVDKSYDPGTSRAVMAFRKTNNMKRTFNASPEIFRMLANGDGSFHLARPGLGRHVEVDISRQVMVLADHGKPQYIFHVSTGAPSTPTIRGTYNFYSRQPGYNSVGMYYSVYFRGGYAIHGYHSVPPYNASHGCVRNPIPNSQFIYNWVSIGMPIAIYS